MARADLRLPSNVPGDLYATMFLTHRDDVADHVAFRARFGADRVIHAKDAAALGEQPEHTLEGTEPVALADDLLAIPTPGHTRGHAVLLRKDVLPGHGAPYRADSPAAMRREVERCVAWMKAR